MLGLPLVSLARLCRRFPRFAWMFRSSCLASSSPACKHLCRLLTTCAYAAHMPPCFGISLQMSAQRFGLQGDSAWDKELANICASHSVAVAQQRFLSALLRPAGRADLELETVSSSPEPLWMLPVAARSRVPKCDLDSRCGASGSQAFLQLVPFAAFARCLSSDFCAHSSSSALQTFRLPSFVHSFIPSFVRSFVRSSVR